MFCPGAVGMPVKLVVGGAFVTIGGGSFGVGGLPGGRPIIILLTGGVGVILVLLLALLGNCGINGVGGFGCC